MNAETKHTRGPLTVRHSEVMQGVVQVFDAEGFPIANFTRADNGEGANLANAILFAAAPDLLAALALLSKWCDDNLNGVPAELGRIQEMADAAIARVRS